jgi:DNA-binding MarR family transcriptional regulator
MNNKDEHSDDYRSFLLLDEISKNNELTQRDLSKKLGVALGLINSYIKNLASKGYITIAAIPKKRYRYYLTPSGFAEKTRLTYQHLQNFTNLYRMARRDFKVLFTKLSATEKKRVVFCGVDEVTEIAYLSLVETDLVLTGIVDGECPGKKFFGHEVRTAGELPSMDYDVIVITSFQGGERLKKELAATGVKGELVCDISGEGWLKRLES